MRWFLIILLSLYAVLVLNGITDLEIYITLPMLVFIPYFLFLMAVDAETNLSRSMWLVGVLFYLLIGLYVFANKF